MRNRALHDQLRGFAERAAEWLTAAVDDGAEIPFEVAESPGATSVLYRYKPLTGRFVREHVAELRKVDGFGATLLSLAKLEGASAYLRVLGVDVVPAVDSDRAETLMVEFLARIWEDATSFDLDDGRFERCYRELESAVFDDVVDATVLAPLLGVRLAADRWQLGGGIALARGDLCEAPPEAVWAAERRETEPHTLVVLTVEAMPDQPPPLTAARLEFRRLLTALRLFKPGAATLGPTAWWRLDHGPWQSLPLGFAGRPRPGDYWLEADEREELGELFELVRQRPLNGGPLPWALARFEMGCEQPLPLEGLSDHLLALSALLDGDDISPAGVCSRLAALCAEAPQRAALQTRTEEAFWLQRRLMRGDVDADWLDPDLDADYLDAGRMDEPDGIARDLEDHLRALLRDMVCGYLEPDIKRTADDLMRLEAEARPEPEIFATATDQRPQRRGRRRKAVPVLESWDEVVTEEEPEPEAEEPPEPDFVVRKKKRAGAKPRRPRQPAKPKPKPRSRREPVVEEPETEETVVVGGIRATATYDDDSLDWGFDDDPGDYSAAV